MTLVPRVARDCKSADTKFSKGPSTYIPLEYLDRNSLQADVVLRLSFMDPGHLEILTNLLGLKNLAVEH